MHASNQQQQSALSRVEFDWRGALGAVIFMVLLTVIGPITLLLAWLLRAWCKRSIFDAHDRWDSVRAFALFFGVLIAAALVFAIFAFTISPSRAHHLWTLLPLHVLGAPDLLGNLWLRWVLSVPLAFAIALSMGWGETGFVRWFTRVPTEREQRRREQEERARREQQAELERAARLAEATKRTTPATAKTTRATLTASASPPANRTECSASTPLQATGPSIIPATGQGKPTLWDELPESHAWKQEAQRQQPQPGRATPPAEPAPPVKKEKPKPPDLGDGSMDALL